jgi:hypothetical protein
MDHYILRSWQCLNKRCGHAFESGERYPECPRCKCVRVDWIPGGGHTAGSAPALDRTLRDLVSSFGLTDINSAERGRQAKKLQPQPMSSGAQMTFAPGFAAPVTPHAVCVPAPNVSFKVKTKVGDRGALAPSPNLPYSEATSSNTRIEGRHKP